MKRGEYYVANISIFKGNPESKYIIVIICDDYFRILDSDDMTPLKKSKMNKFEIISKIDI